MGEKEKILKCEKVLKIGEPAQEETIAKYDGKTGEYLSSDDERKAYLYDERTGNVHLIPKDDTDRISEAVREKRRDVRAALREKIRDKKGWILKARAGCGRKQYRGLYDFLRIQVETRIYELMFFRMAYDSQKKQMECHLESIQFSYYTGDIKSYLVYPASMKNDWTAKAITEKGYYNPQISFSDDNKEIAEAFIRFIETKEKEFHQ